MKREQNRDSQKYSIDKDVYTFLQEGGQWYICPAGNLSIEWQMKDLQLVEGSYKILNLFSAGSNKVRLRLSREFFEGANLLELIELDTSPHGGGIYVFNPGKQYSNCQYWICDLALLIFGDIPERIYIKRLPINGKEVFEWQERDNDKQPSTQSTWRFK